MAKTRSMTRNHSHDDNVASSSRKRSKACDNDGVSPWSDLNHDVLLLVMMKLGVIDFLSFSGVCKSWRTLAHSNRNMFMAFQPPLYVHASRRAYRKACYLEDFEGRKFKTILPRFSAGVYVGLTCGYLILFSERTRDFWLVNPITRHELHFPDFPISFRAREEFTRAILVFSSSISGWVFLVRLDDFYGIWSSIAGKGAWNNIPCPFPIHDFHAFKGILYTLHLNASGWVLCELKLHPDPEFWLFKTQNYPTPNFYRPSFVSSDENLYMIDSVNPFRVHELDIGEMKWVLCEKPKGEYALFLSNLNIGVAVKPESWADPWSQFGIYDDREDDSRESGYDSEGKMKFFTTKLWYFPNKCLNVDRIEE